MASFGPLFCKSETDVEPEPPDPVDNSFTYFINSLFIFEFLDATMLLALLPLPPLSPSSRSPKFADLPSAVFCRESYIVLYFACGLFTKSFNLGAVSVVLKKVYK